MSVSHGGNLLQVAQQYETAAENWIDLSTGVSPFTYPIGDIPESFWNQLPQVDDGLEAAAKAYYNGPTNPLAVAGSQAAIMALPTVITEQLGKCGVVALPRVGYKEHEHAWRNFIHKTGCWSLIFYDDIPSVEQIMLSDVVVIINPNNPTANLLDRDSLFQLQSKLVKRNGILIVDEAFVDSVSKYSILSVSEKLENLIVLRSVGKFFGLAGARVGFVFATENIKAQLKDHLGPWTVSGPSRWVMRQALTDIRWQKRQTEKIEVASDRLEQLLGRYLSLPVAGATLFKTIYLKNASMLYDLLCKEQILSRLCDEKNAIRLGLPACELQWQRLEAALSKISKIKLL